MLRLFRKKKKDPAAELRAVLGEFELPTFPAIVAAALERVRDENASTEQVGDLIASDPGLSVHLLSAVNSAAFALRHRVRNLHHAVSLLGSNQVESMLISIAVRNSLPHDSARGFDDARFWATAARRAATARAMADLIDPSTASESFTAALLQDMAIPILSRARGDAYGEVLERWHEGPDDLVAIEREVFDWDHALVAMWMCNAWSVPVQIADAIGAHHGDRDEALTGLPAVSLVSVLREVDTDLGVERLVDEAEARFQLPRDRVHELIRTSFETATEIAALFN